MKIKSRKHVDAHKHLEKSAKPKPVSTKDITSYGGNTHIVDNYKQETNFKKRHDHPDVCL